MKDIKKGIENILKKAAPEILESQLSEEETRDLNPAYAVMQHLKDFAYHEHQHFAIADELRSLRALQTYLQSYITDLEKQAQAQQGYYIESQKYASEDIEELFNGPTTHK